MPTNKHAVIRFNVIDKCLRNTGRLWTFDDIKEAVENKLSEIDPTSSGISIKSLRNDFAFMRSDEGYEAPIESYRHGKKHYIRYADPNFSINQKPLSDTDAEKLNSAISILQRFEGSPEFEWIEDIALILKDHFSFQQDNRKIVGHDNDINISYSGYHLITPIFNAISNKRVLEINYESFRGEKHTFEFHPYYLKQYNKRWFVFGLHVTEKNPHWNLPLDRISGYNELNTSYIEDDTNWEFYFSDIIGVTMPKDKTKEEIRMRFDPDRAPYVITKPIHESQKLPIHNEDGTVDILIQVIPNPELISKILSFGQSVEVISPHSLREQIIQRLNGLNGKYGIKISV